MHPAIRNVHKIKDSLHISVVITTADHCSRMTSYGPKALIKVGNKTVLDRQIYYAEKSFGNSDIIVVSGLDSKRVMDNTPPGIVSIENTEYADTNVARSLGMGLRAMTGNAVVFINGDVVFTRETLRFTTEKSALVIDSGGMNDKEVGCLIQNGKIDRLFYQYDHKWAQIAFFRDAELDILKRIVWNPKNSRMFAYEIINEIIESGGSFVAYEDKKVKATDIDSSKDIQKAEEII